ncbi:hypothetical protein BDF22DRAFT_699123 [Syncephalis plumigaleata]|nr:hypothetical protein BDF22DRAFT_699123 [Syncephalis plumigaleata]
MNKRSFTSPRHNNNNNNNNNNAYEEREQETYYYGRNDCKLKRHNTFGNDCNSVDDAQNERQSASTSATCDENNSSSNPRVAYPALHHSRSLDAVKSSHTVCNSRTARLTPPHSIKNDDSDEYDDDHDEQMDQRMAYRHHRPPSGQYSHILPPFIGSTAKRSQSSKSLPSKFERDDDAAEIKAQQILNLSCLYCSFRRKHPRVPSLCSPTEDQEDPIEVQADDTSIEFYKAFESDGGENDFIPAAASASASSSPFSSRPSSLIAAISSSVVND